MTSVYPKVFQVIGRSKGFKFFTVIFSLTLTDGYSGGFLESVKEVVERNECALTDGFLDVEGEAFWESVRILSFFDIGVGHSGTLSE
ncbi:MAG: hypothetical protein C5B43_03650 [Verrucomicrobia bacterium]|nr:MAG: hypothetical protein C5B43_03650 [Verrucomicrobiota bacterium]